MNESGKGKSMIGVTSYGGYIPLFRLSRDAIAKAWGGRSAGGERSVANHDEDSMTMAAEAVFACLKDLDQQGIDGLFFASTTSPYREKQCATTIAAVADLPAGIITADFANSLRAGGAALRAAISEVKSGSSKSIVVAAGDCRLGFPQSEQEQGFGDAGAAMLIGETGVIAAIEHAYSVSDEIIDVWRTDNDTFVRSWEDRWVITEGYQRSMTKAITEVMKKAALTAKDITKALLYAPDSRSHRELAQSLGFDVKIQLQNPLLDMVGNTGAAHPLLMLAAALEEAKPGDMLLLASYGQGADAFVLRVTEEIDKRRDRKSIKGLLNSKIMLPSYEKYLYFRQLLTPSPELFNIDSAATILWRTRNWAVSLHGSRCRQCGMISFPIQRICYGCQSKDDYEEVRLSDKKGKVFTFSLDNLAGGPAVPLPQTVVESDEGKARIYCQMTDCDPSQVTVGMPVEMTFRRIREARGFHNYFWKCRPIR